ncbi:MAG: Vitamin B12 dependent methionine synthase activation subunit [Clostridia bacterium]|nr:Vitamin B12 dependent methionine synthase activation subunit [Clostridia bacterium]
MNEKNIRRYLRITGEPDDATARLIRECMEEAAHTMTPKRIFRIYDMEMREDGVLIGDTFFEGTQIAKRLQDFDKCALMAVTLGVPCDTLIRKYSVSRPSKAAVMQAVLADMTEDICDRTEADIRLTPPGYTVGQRFSPGYPGLPLEFQKKIFAMLDISKRIGITLTATDLMLPSKSVTAFAGLKENGTCEI